MRLHPIAVVYHVTCLIKIVHHIDIGLLDCIVSSHFTSLEMLFRLLNVNIIVKQRLDV